ncbi:formate dehydrogenase subunit gamma [Phaeovulum sp.]|uniref:formate dehydrogenase subunit gamma n=1 Tax=Phaeovulum sp. TaxID=2934796 RepID=UPI0039E28967
MTEAATAERVDAILRAHQGLEGPLLPILHAVQAEFGLIPAAAVAPIAKALTLTRAEVEGVISFYHDFRRVPAGRHVIKLCRAEACQSMGGAATLARMEAALGLKIGQTRADVTLEAVYCLGLCACAPAAMVDGRLIGRLDDAKVAEIAAEVSA